MEEDDELFNPLSLVIGNTIDDLSIVYKIKEELTKESDRGCCLVAAAYMELELKNIISNFLIDMSQKESNELFNYTGPIGTFSSKIKLAYSLGLISKEISFFINQLRAIRNIAAHLEDPFDFREKKITDHIKNIIPSLNGKYQCIREELIEKIIVIISTLHYNRTNTFRRTTLENNLIEIKENIKEQELHLAALILMDRSANDTSYEQALSLARKINQIQ